MSESADITTIDAATATEAEAQLAPLFEGAPAFLARLAAARPFGAWGRLFERARTIAHAMPEGDQVELIDAHPRLGASPAAVSAMSYREQGYDREAVPRMREEDAGRNVAAELARLNDAYETRFGFRYCVFVADRSREALLPEMAAALTAERDAELHRALDAVVDIAQDRHRSLTQASRDGDRPVEQAVPASRSPASHRSNT